MHLNDTKSDYGKLLMIEPSGSFLVTDQKCHSTLGLGGDESQKHPLGALARANPPKLR